MPTKPQEPILRIRFDRNDEVRELKSQFRVLRGWKITWNGRTKHKGETWINLPRRRATICASSREPEPPSYLLHEILHVALAATESDDSEVARERQEVFVQDVCELFAQRIAREEGRLVALEHRAGCDRDIISALESARKTAET